MSSNKIHNNNANNSGNQHKPTLLARLDFPPYAIKVISERHFMIAGGGGSSKTGVPNCVDIYELIYDPTTNSARVELAARLDNGLILIFVCFLA